MIDLISRHVTKRPCVRNPAILLTARVQGLAPIKLATLSAIASLAPKGIFFLKICQVVASFPAIRLGRADLPYPTTADRQVDREHGNTEPSRLRA